MFSSDVPLQYSFTAGVASDVPLGAGLSSSAALEVSTSNFIPPSPNTQTSSHTHTYTRTHIRTHTSSSLPSYSYRPSLFDFYIVSIFLSVSLSPPPLLSSLFRWNIFFFTYFLIWQGCNGDIPGATWGTSTDSRGIVKCSNLADFYFFTHISACVESEQQQRRGRT